MGSFFFSIKCQITLYERIYGSAERMAQKGEEEEEVEEE